MKHFKEIVLLNIIKTFNNVYNCMYILILILFFINETIIVYD